MHISANTEGTGLCRGLCNEVAGPGEEAQNSSEQARVFLWSWGLEVLVKNTLWNVHIRQLFWAQSWPAMRILQTAIYGFINKWLDVKSLESFPFPQQLQEQIITIQVGLRWKLLDWQESLTAVLMSKSPRQEIQCQRVQRTFSQAKSICTEWTHSWVKIYYCQ